ncbi:hypothetical protein EYF80_006345 [Liparis tanakae]|uniref:Uncharacterized protein n=1 Tax=Liparis tanakae TaxID=230148 RepID=A0A4Z2J0M6_9TELE|nr:hypothetical protein EYF80_006345 [Liparis tanakae]
MCSSGLTMAVMIGAAAAAAGGGWRLAESGRARGLEASIYQQASTKQRNESLVSVAVDWSGRTLHHALEGRRMADPPLQPSALATSRWAKTKGKDSWRNSGGQTHALQCQHHDPRGVLFP